MLHGIHFLEACVSHSRDRSLGNLCTSIVMLLTHSFKWLHGAPQCTSHSSVDEHAVTSTVMTDAECYKGRACPYTLMYLMVLLLWVRVLGKGAKDKRLPEQKNTQEQSKTNKRK